MLRLVEPLPEPVDMALTVAQAARALGCSPSTVRALVSAGRLAAHRVGKCDNPRGVRVSLEAVNRYKALNAVAPVHEHEGPPRRPVESPNHRAAISRLKARGVL